MTKKKIKDLGLFDVFHYVIENPPFTSCDFLKVAMEDYVISLVDGGRYHIKLFPEEVEVTGKMAFLTPKQQEYLYYMESRVLSDYEVNG